MAISVLDVRDTLTPSLVRPTAVRPTAVRPTAVVPVAVVPAARPAARRRLPMSALAAGTIGIAEGVALLAVALTGLDGVLVSPDRPAGWLVAGGLVLLAGWIVLAAGSGAALLDGAGRMLVVGVAYAELGLVGLLAVVSVADPLVSAPGGLPLPAFLLLLAAVPVGKLLLVGSPSAGEWIAAGPRVRERRPDPVAVHRGLATVTLLAIGLVLGAVALLTPVEAGGTDAPYSRVVSDR